MPSSYYFSIYFPQNIKDQIKQFFRSSKFKDSLYYRDLSISNNVSINNNFSFIHKINNPISKYGIDVHYSKEECVYAEIYNPYQHYIIDSVCSIMNNYISMLEIEFNHLDNKNNKKVYANINRMSYVDFINYSKDKMFHVSEYIEFI